MPAAIDPDAIPGKDLDPDTVEAQAVTITSIAASVRDNGSQVHLKWQGMAGVYSAPEAGMLLGLMQPVSSQATATGDNLDAVSAALTQFAADVRPIKAELDALRLSAQEFRDEIAGGVSVRELNPEWTTQQAVYGTTGSGEYSGSWNAYGATTSSSTASTDVPKYQTVTKQWHESQEHIDRNNELISAVNAQQVALWEAERTCANKIRSLYGAAALHAFQSENDPHGYGLDAIPEGTEMPWGASVERTESCGEAAVNFVVKDFLWEGLIVGGVWGTIQGLGTLTLGYNPATGEWFSGDAYGAAWGNLGLLVASGVMNSPVLAPILWADQGMEAAGAGGFLPDEIRDFKAQADEAALNTGKALIAWDKWADDPGTALGESVFNVGTALIPVGGAAIASVKTASAAASVISKMARVVDLVDPGAWAFNGITRLGGAGLGSLDNLIGNLSSKIDPPHIEVYAATDSASALDALADWGVDLNSVTARVDDGVPVLEAPGIRVELPGGTFDGIRAGGTDAAIPAPVREPELVAAGGAHGETGPGPVNSIVDEAPVRTETGEARDGTIVREPERGPSHGGSDSSSSGASDSSSSGASDTGSSAGDDAANIDGTGDDSPSGGTGDGGAMAADPVSVGDPTLSWGGDTGYVDIRSVLDLSTPEPPIGPVNPDDVTFAIAPDHHVFWSGRTAIEVAGETKAYGSGGIAAGLAERYGATTLELYLRDHGIAMPPWGRATEHLWGEISRKFAESAAGDVRVVLGRDLRPGNVWETYEFGALRDNPAVTRIIAIDPESGSMRVLFDRSAE